MIKNNECINVVANLMLIRDSFIDNILISYNDGICITIGFLKSNYKEISIEFIGVQNFDLISDPGDSNGYLISHYKLINVNERYYFSFDPFDENVKNIDENDNNCILCNEIELKYLNL
jgi:hypothetical protein